MEFEVGTEIGNSEANIDSLENVVDRLVRLSQNIASLIETDENEGGDRVVVGEVIEHEAEGIVVTSLGTNLSNSRCNE